MANAIVCHNLKKYCVEGYLKQDSGSRKPQKFEHPKMERCDFVHWVGPVEPTQFHYKKND